MMLTKTYQRTNGPVNAHLIFGPCISINHTKPDEKLLSKPLPLLFIILHFSNHLV